MKRIMKRVLSATLASVMMTSALAGCSSSGSPSTNSGSGSSNAPSSTGTNNSAPANNTTPSTEPVTIKFLHKGPKPDGWDDVYAKYLEMTKDSLNIQLDINWVEHADYKEKLNLEITSGSDWDLVFDASWVQLKNLAPEGYYADLSAYFNNPSEYPGLAKAFTADTMTANTWYGKMCYIPLYEVYGNGIPVVWYRKDWAKEWGVGTDGKINSYEEMEKFWQAALDHGKIGYGASQARGFFQQKSLRGEAYPGSAQAGLMQFSAGGLTMWTYTKDNKLVAVAVEGSGDESFANFPEGWQRDFGIDRYEDFARWQDAGYIDPDSMSCTDYETPFSGGLSASVVGTLDDYVKYMGFEDNLGKDTIGFFVYVDDVREMKKNAIPVNYEGNNGLAVPASSTKIDSTMKFLDWLFGSQEAHDLFQLGIEGKDFEYVGDNSYKTLTSYSADFGGYGWTWNPEYALISAAYTEEALAYRKYEYEPDTFTAFPVLGFHFDTTNTELSTAIAQCKAVTDNVAIVKLHGIRTDGNGYAIPLSYRLDLDGRTADSGEFDGWILGRGEVSADVRGISKAVLALRQGGSQNEIGNPIPTPQGVFWGEICLELEDGTTLNLGKCLKDGNLPWVHMENVDEGFGIGRDYKDGRVTIVGTEYLYSLGASPVDHKEESRICLDLSGLHAVKLTACVGVDAFEGDEWQRRKTYAVRSFGKIGRYLTVVEPYEKESVIEKVTAEGPDSVRVTLKDGTVQTIAVSDIEKENPSISWTTEGEKSK
ncbi:MAG: extracellular solute-binding protein [Oscillospiraceae bacterium]|nr:extracellular solute-binding protein [Oscillospiraceae bacterium]